LDRAQRTALACLAVVAAAVAVIRIPALWGTIQDDGFIYFRIATNAASALGPVFNPGDRVDAATSPVWTALLAIAARLGAPLTIAAPLVGLLCTIATIVLVARWMMELAPPRTVPAVLLGLVAPLLLVADARFWLYAFSGMETPLAALTWIWATRALVQRWFQGKSTRVAGWALLVACLVRPEFVLFAVGFAVVAIVRRTIAPGALLRTLLPALVGGVAYLVAHTLYFGDPLPNTYYAKRASDWTHVRIGLDYLRQLPATYPALLFAFVALAAPSLRGVASGWTLGIVLFTFHVVSLGGDHFVFHRPYVLVRPMALALAGAAAIQIWTTRSLPIRVATAALAAAALLVTARQRVPAGAFAWVRNSGQLGYALARTYPPDTRVGMFAIGAAGYTSGLPVVDALGLADRTVARHDFSHEHCCALDIGHERGDPAYVLDHADVVVLFGAYSPVPFESLEEVREGFYSHKKFLAAAEVAVAKRRFRLRDLEFAPGAHWAVLEKLR
jgi:hypothetical protein